MRDLERGAEYLDRAIGGVEPFRVPSDQTYLASPPESFLERGDWPEPQSLTADRDGTARAPYPVSALPDLIRLAVLEVLDFSQAPDSLVATSAVGALSLAAQGLADVQRDEGLTGPVAIWLLTVAESGERKSTADRYFTQPIRDYERDEQETNRPTLSEYRARKEAWEAKKAGLRDAIKQAARTNEDPHEDERRLELLQTEEPQEPRIPRLIYSDATPEALAFGLARWPSAGVISAEAGAVFGAHAMGRESITRNLAQLNSLWDGGEIRVDRRKEGASFVARGGRLTVSLQVQEAALREFFDKAGSLARGMGFFARFLYSQPTSNQGNRTYRAPPADWPCLRQFHARISDLLQLKPPMNERGELSPPILVLTSEARALWIDLYNSVEQELGVGGKLGDVRDVASKAADNVARLAALFHILEHGPQGAIGADHLRAAGRLVTWHLMEASRFLGEFSLPASLVNALGWTHGCWRIAVRAAWIACLAHYCRTARQSETARSWTRL